MREIRSSKISCKGVDGSELVMSSSIINHPLDIATGRDRVFGVGNMPQMIDLCGTAEPELLVAGPAQEEPAFLQAPIDLSKIHQRDTRQQSLIIQDLTTVRKKLELENQNLRDQLEFAQDIIRKLREEANHKDRGDNLPGHKTKGKKKGRYFSSHETVNEKEGSIEGTNSRRASNSAKATAKTRIKFWAKHQKDKKPPLGLTKKETFQNHLGGPKKFDLPTKSKIETTSTCAKSSSTTSSSNSSRTKGSSNGRAEPGDSSTIITRSSTGQASRQLHRSSVSSSNDCGRSRFEGSYQSGVVRSSTGASSQQPSRCSVGSPTSCSTSRFEGSYQTGAGSSSHQPSFGSVSTPNSSRFEGSYQQGPVHREPAIEECIRVPDNLMWLCSHSADSAPSQDTLYGGDKYQKEAVHSALGLTRSYSTASTESRDSLIDGDKYQCEGELAHY